MNLRTWSAAAMFCAAAACPPVQAQSLYRCGNVYQDRPCEGGQAGKIVGNASSGAPAPKLVSDPECAQRGASSLKITWSREAGASAEKLIADLAAKTMPAAQKEQERKVIDSVYQKRGSAPEIRAAVEAECMAEKEKAAQAGATQPAAPPVPASTQARQPNPVAETDAGAAEKRRRDETAAREKAERQARCNSLKASKEGIQNSQRAGGGIGTMEQLNRQLNEINDKQRAAGCA